MPGSFKDYRYTIAFGVSILLAAAAYAWGWFDKVADIPGSFGYVTSFIAGLMFSSTFTAAPAAFLFVEFGSHLSPLSVALVGGLGAMAGDLIMYRFIKNNLLKELKTLGALLFSTRSRVYLERISRHRVFLWTTPFIASLLIASPLPDELGVALFSLVNFQPKYLSLITFLLNAAGIFALVFFGHTLSRP
ncbi:MAG: hypothetical protein UY92_C0003G0049 [Candidatus Magasanikbacteria bacterium GW2011_GWA2_56_11]|uniref:TVP38/TMEM64 family membrane protein n=1 Tax=Candidatus Magasanikbacteria bacterium GW2011_GWA2_56_11 TaxID=1619044 RepID=A0A0G1YHC5_9BACT|nr:MAG: hypothetical protein UY92_C0003G0049 [Candidatus Magasanikbacteria bacterium GW2011_GWA2_56_11]